jgi:hypothetical protein
VIVVVIVAAIAVVIGVLGVVAVRCIAVTDAEDRRRGHVVIASRRGTRTYSSALWTEVRSSRAVAQSDEQHEREHAGVLLAVSR